MFSKVLIANRGEIACRIIRTLDRLQIASVAVYSEADLESLHVAQAGQAVLLGPAPAADSYLRGDKIIEAALSTGAQAIHPGYGFLSENPGFARDCARAGLVFVGPTPGNMETFGLKHKAREAALAAGVPLLPGTGLLADLAEAQKAADQIGWPVILKSTGGGGGIGMKVCADAAALREAWTGVKALAERNFKDAGVYLEKYVSQARHIEVQVFGDGLGGIAVLGDRDCSAQRRNQKVVEETPAPGLRLEVRSALHGAARALTAHARYANAGTVEFVYDTTDDRFYFLEVNTRLQVEHTVTEEVFGVDLVEWMLRQAAGEWSVAEGEKLTSQGASVQVRLYAEDPGKNFQPCDGLVTQAQWPAGARVETWIRPGVVMTTRYDPLLAKLIVTGPSRDLALDGLVQALRETSVGGLQTNRLYLLGLLDHPVFRQARTTTGFLAGFSTPEPVFEVLVPGTQTTVQDWPGRQNLWQVGIPPSGPMDELSFRLANRLLGNDSGAAGLEITLSGPTLRFRGAVTACLTGSTFDAKLDGQSLPWGQSFEIPAGGVLEIGASTGAGQRAYLALAGGLDVPDYLGSKSTFTLGGFGGHGGRALKAGDVLGWRSAPAVGTPAVSFVSPQFGPGWDPHWIRVLYGPQGAPEFFKQADIQRFLDAEWEVHFNSSRTGVRLIGPTPDWPRVDGGEAGLHPSNLHDNAYAIGALDFTGDMPVLLGPDGPSLGGFVCPLTVIRADLWKLGQLKPGAKIRFQAVGFNQARTAAAELENLVQTLTAAPAAEPGFHLLEEPILAVWHDCENRPVTLRRSGDRRLLLEVGAMLLDLELRLVIQWWHSTLEAAHLPGILDLTPGIRSLQIHFDDDKTRAETVIAWLEATLKTMPPLAEVQVPSRTVWLPLSWDDPSTRLAIQKYMTAVRADAPWCPWNIEFIRRINGLDTWEEVRDIVFQAEYLVLGLGDVYLGAPVATPLDPRHRLVTTKYNPARTWTPENAVGIGGAYLCVYGMEGPGGYQFVGRTVQMWNRWFTTRDFPKPWLLRFFDKLRFYPVSAEQLTSLRRDLPLGRAGIRVEEGTFVWRDYQAFLERESGSIDAFKVKQQAAFADERQRWKEAGLDQFRSDSPPADSPEISLPAGSVAVESPVSGVLWQLECSPGQKVVRGQTLAILESMKMEIQLEAPAAGTVTGIYLKPGAALSRGQVVIALGRS